MNDSTKKGMIYFLFLMMLVSSFVSFEPAPYDLLMMIFIGGSILLSRLKLTRELAFPFVLICFFLISNLISLLLAEDMAHSLFFTGITFYLVLTWITLILMGHYLNQKSLQIILNGYLISALFATLAGTLAYFQIFIIDADLIMFDRVKAFFKDPNVFGPYLVLPALFSIYMWESQSKTKSLKMFYLISFLVLGMGIILSFSRAAWGNFALSLTVYLLIIKGKELNKRVKTVLVLFFIATPLFIYLVQTPAVAQLFESRLGYQGYDDTRFNTQKAVITAGLSNPWGIGGGQSDQVVQTDPHNLYARVFTENGVLGIITLAIFLLLSIKNSYSSFRRKRGEFNQFYVMVFATLLGLVFNGFFVDTLHWRHLWFLLALAWIPYSEAKQKIK